MHLKSLFIAWKCTVADAGCTAARALSATVLSSLVAFSLVAGPAAAQTPSAGGRHEIFAGSELEKYIRYIQSFDTAGTHQWSVRPFSTTEIDAILARERAGPWSARFDLGGAPRPASEMEIIPPTVSARFNSAFPFGGNDGPIWAGRGLTTAAQLGFFARFGPLSITLAPTFFRAENATFDVAPSGRICPPACGDVQYPDEVDYPQRFGNSAYQRFDPGQSTIRLDALGGTIGVSTANEWWGPTQEYPFILGNNAPGFAHAFFGTSRPLDIFIGHLSGRILYGKLEQSAYSPVTGSKYYTSPTQTGTSRLASGLITVLEPRGLTGLELGFGRFFQTAWPSSGIPSSFYRRPFEALYKANLPVDTANANQLASVFGRWVFPRSALEIYGEYGREDHNYDFRDLMQEPDHSRTYSLGLRKAFHIQENAFDAIHVELMNYQVPTLAREGRGEGGIYIHGGIRQGHTNGGQLLGAPLGVGAAAGSTLGWDRYGEHGRTSLTWQRIVSRESGTFFTTGVIDPKSSDVSHALGVERVQFLSRMDLSSALMLVREFNRDFTHDAWNLNARVEARLRLR
jgi:hypothetical protein